MPALTFERLSAQDATFLAWEDEATHMQVAATMIFEADPVRSIDGGIAIDRIRDYVASRLHRIPRYRQRLGFVPIDRHPVWIDDQHFNIHYHVRHTSLPRPGTERQLKRLSGRILSQQLDRTKPLWEFWVVEGLDGGKRFAVVTKVHHCMVDGVAGVDLMTALMTPEPVREFEAGPRFIPRRPPSRLALLGDDLLWRAAQPLRVLGALRRPEEQVGRVLERLARGVRATAEFIGTGLQRGSDTPLNTPVGPHRRFDWLEIDLNRVKEVKNRLGGTVNDVVLATTAGAVRRFLEDRRVAPDTVRFRVLAPVSVRGAVEQGALGNRVSAWFVDLPIGESDPKRRIEAIRETTRHLKKVERALGADALTQVSEWTGSTLLAVGARLATLLRPFNLIVTNVPGPQIPLYLLGARMVASYPQVPLFINQALGVALFSYAGSLCWGFNSDWDLVPDLHDFVIHVDAAFRELELAAGITSASREGAVAAPKRTQRSGGAAAGAEERKRQAGPRSGPPARPPGHA